MKPLRYRYGSGFTLMEVMVAIAVFAVIAAGVYRVLSTMVETQSRITAHTDALRGLQRSMWFIAMDMNQLVMRDVRKPDDNRSPALVANADNYILQFTRQGVRNPLLLARSDLERVAYSVGTPPDTGVSKKTTNKKFGKSLLRHTWAALDRKDGAEENIQVLIDGVSDVKFEFLDQKGNWKTEWPEKKLDDKAHIRDLPAAIKMTIKTDRYGEIQQIYQTGDVVKKEKVPVSGARQ